MTWLIPAVIAAAVVALILVILVRTLRFKPKDTPVKPAEDIDLPRKRLCRI